MIFTRTPLRISIGGGGTDLPSYYEQFGGFVVSAAIDKYIYIAINKTFYPGYLLKYSKTEKAQNYDDIEHEIFREALRLHEIEPNVEIVSVADSPAGTGLGSSGTFTVGLLRALFAYKRQHVDSETLAKQAVEIGLGKLGEPVGKQDQYIAAYGGILCQEYCPNGSVMVTPLKINECTQYELSENLMMFFTGYSRSASHILVDQKVKSEQNDQQMLENLHRIKAIGLEIKTALENGDTLHFAELMHQHWLFKKNRSTGISNETINQLYDYARQHGALGGKLIGAGGGGFMLFYTRDCLKLRKAMTMRGLQEMPFKFDFDGSIVLLRN